MISWPDKLLINKVLIRIWHWVIRVRITWPVYCTLIGWRSGDLIRIICNIINYIYLKGKIKIDNYNGSKPEILRILWDNLVFRLVAYLLKMICLNHYFHTILYINEFLYNFDTVFFINFSRQEHQMDFLYVSFYAWDSQVSSYTPFHFSFTVSVIPI